MHLILGEVRGNSAEAERLYAESFPNCQGPVIILSISHELAHLYLFTYFLVK
jgi:hypothetical protein